MKLIRENKILTRFVILRETFPIFHRDCDEISPENSPFAQEISPCIPCCAASLSRDDNKGYRNDNNIISDLNSRYKGLQLMLSIVLMLILISTNISAQNIMQIKNAQGVINSNVVLPILIANDEEFISFQCDVLLPDGFTYVPNSITLTARSVDHVVNVTNIENNTIRVLSYSLNNTAFLADSGNVAIIGLTTPQNEGDFTIGINNGIIGNAESINILDSVVYGNITIGPIGINENDFDDNRINCFPNPFSYSITIQMDVDYPQLVNLCVYNINGRLVSIHNVYANKAGLNNFDFNSQILLGVNPSPGTYIILFNFMDIASDYKIVKKIKFNTY